jgi:hypothetical protein
MADDSPTSSVGVPPPKQYWFIEVWSDYREAFKFLIADTVVFAIVILVLSVSHFILGKSHLPPGRTEVLERIHYYAYVAFLTVIFGGFILKVVVFQYNGFKKLQSLGR